VKTVMSNMGRSLMGTGVAKGQNRARLAAEMAVTSPLLDDISVEGATGVLINIVGGPDLKMKEIQEAASLVQEQAHEDANIIFGASIDDTMGENVKVTVIATGFDAQDREAALDVAASRQSLVPQTLSSSQPRAAASSSAAPRAPHDASTAPSMRRPVHAAQGALPGPDLRASAAVPVPRSALRDRAPAVQQQDAFPLEHDWDVPAFQRKQR
jgi:cell division protein FtsZ